MTIFMQQQQSWVVAKAKNIYYQAFTEIIYDIWKKGLE